MKKLCIGRMNLKQTEGIIKKMSTGKDLHFERINNRTYLCWK